MTATTIPLATPMTRDETATLIGRTMGFVAATAGTFALGAYLGRDLLDSWSLVIFLGAFAMLIAINATAQRSPSLAVALLLAFGLLIGLSTAPTLNYYASTDPAVLWQTGGATALFVAGFGAAGYATRRDLSALARYLLWALVALIVFGVVLILVQIPHGSLIYSLLGLAIFAAVSFRLSAAATHQGHQMRTPTRRVKLPRHPECVLAPAADLRR